MISAVPVISHSDLKNGQRGDSRHAALQLLRYSVLAMVLICGLLSRAQSGLDTAKWLAYSRAGGSEASSQACFMPNNVAVSGGNLVLTSKLESAACKSIDLPQATHNYTSAFVAMRNFNFLYGTVEVRAKFGGGMSSGSWPVVWFLDASCQASDPTGTDDRCTGQEIDMAEILDGNFRLVNEQIHIDNFKHNDGCKAPAADTSQDFHTYQMDWSSGLLVFRIDGKTTCTLKNKYVPSAPIYLKFTVYVGGFGGPVKDNTLPWTTLIDYVKISQGSNVIFEDQFNEPPAVTPPPKKPAHKKVTTH
jgi:beta-glucanase (GH16 family)